MVVNDLLFSSSIQTSRFTSGCCRRKHFGTSFIFILVRENWLGELVTDLEICA